MSTAPETTSARSRYLLGDAIHAWPPETAAAWTGLLDVVARLRRDLDRRLEAEHGLSASMVGLLGRLAAADRRTLRLSDIAASMAISLGRVSRIVDAVERRGLVERRPNPSDRRATDARLTRKGTAVTHKAQATAAAVVKRSFVEALDADRMQALAAAFGALLDAGHEEGIEG
jgi:DNA-binding MarR family transcriptional regulator